ncbi:MAG TPA: transporter substrate-binding domain-containing protein [Planctomycetota bacterium]
MNTKHGVFCALSLSATAAFCLALAGCGGGNSADSLSRIQKDGVMRWGADASGGAPFVFEKDNAVIGFEMDVMDKLAAHMKVKHERVQADWDALIDNMLAGRTDIVVNGIEINEARQKVVDFTVPYCAYEQQLTVRAEDKDKYKTLDDLKGKPIATLKAAEANNVLKTAGFSEDLIKPQSDSSIPYTELENKRVEAVLQESCIAGYYAAPKTNLYNVPKTFSPGKYAIAVRKGNPKLVAELNRVIELMKTNGELAAIYKKWNIWADAQKTMGIVEK